MYGPFWLSFGEGDAIFSSLRSSFILGSRSFVAQAVAAQNAASVLHTDLFAADGGIGDETAAVQILPVHIHTADLVVVVGVIVIDALVGVAAGGEQRDLIPALSQLAAAALLVYL